MSMFTGSLGSISKLGDIAPRPIEFTGWGTGLVFDWYKTLQNKSIKTLQIRKDVGGAVHHRFILVHMCDGSTHRFDRRPLHPDESNTMAVLTGHPVESADSYVPNINFAYMQEIRRVSHCEIELALDGEVDLLPILAACYAISKNTDTQKYTLFKYNCFFFSWTVLMVVSRHHLPYEIPRYESLKNRFESHSGDLTQFIVDEAVELFLDLVIETVTIFRETAGPPLLEGMYPITRAIWSLPISVLRFLWRRLFTIRLHFGLRKQLILGVEVQLEKRIAPVYQSIVKMYTETDLLDSNLWFEEVRAAVEPTLRGEVAKVLWDAILEAISAGLGDVKPEDLAQQLENPLKPSLLGKNTAQFCAMWNAALHGGMPAAMGAAQGHYGNLSDADVFDMAWFAARDAALAASQTVIENTKAQINNPKRDTMWELVWSIWNKAWEKTHAVVQPRSVAAVKTIVDRIIETGLVAVIQEMKESKNKTVEARIPKDNKWLSSHFKSTSRVSSAILQEYMQTMMKGGTVGPGTLSNINTSMGRIWKEARQHLHDSTAAPKATAESSQSHAWANLIVSP